MRAWLLTLAALGCGSTAVPRPSDTGSSPQGETQDTAPATDTHPVTTPTPTGDTGPAQPTGDTGSTTTGLLELACAPTGNVLRYACTVTTDPAEAVTVTWQRVGGGPIRSRTSETATTHAIDVILLEFDTVYLVTAATADDQVSVQFLTGAAPFDSLVTHLTMSGASTMGLIGTELPCSQAAVAVVYDTATGGLVWYENLDPVGMLGLLDMVRFTDDRTVIGETGTRVVEVDRTGQTLASFSHAYPGCCSLNHEIFAWNGLYVSQYQETTGILTLDNIVALDASGTEVHEWRPAAHLAVPGGAAGDYLHTNSQYVDAAGDLYLSWLSRDSIAKIAGSPTGPSWGAPRWIMTGDGQPGAFGNDITIDWGSITPASFGGQHNAHLRHDGRLMFLDNDHGRGLVMTVDDQTLTATVDAAYRTREPFCGPQGTAMDTRAGNAVVGCDTAWVREYDLATSAQIWEARIECPNGRGGGFTRGAATRWYPLDHWD